MGRYDFRPARVRQTAALLLDSRRMTQPPPWFQIMQDIPPSEILVRTQPVQHIDSFSHKRTRKPSKLFKPQRIAYQEDGLRREFFGDHPWELARPRIMLENEGKDHYAWDWSMKEQPGRAVNGESVVQRQKYLMTLTHQTTIDGKPVTVAKYTKDTAYDIARKELYSHRHSEEIEARVAHEEALSTGAYFGKSTLQIGMELENKTFEQWKAWAQTQVTLAEQAKNAAYTGLGTQSTLGDGSAAVSDEEGMGDKVSPLENAAKELLGGSISRSRSGQEAKGGATFGQ